ncbi:MAG: ribosome small subunit-dependent GTPase A [Eubacterium sp.]
MIRGKIIKGIAGFYYVHVNRKGIYECKAKGIFRNKSIKPLVGDNVEIDILDEELKKGNISGILPRNNELIRPAAANIDQALIVFAMSNPQPNLNLLDRFLVMMEYWNIDAIICFNKTDICSDEDITLYHDTYCQAGYKVLLTSISENNGIEEVRKVLNGKTTVLAGPSGVGKSSMLNALLDTTIMETGAVSDKIGRGRHTTRHSEIFNIGEQTYIVDTPGFSSLYLENIECGQLRFYFPEFSVYEGKCRYNGCVHINEPDCAVKKSVEEGNIPLTRYKNYIQMYNEYKNKKKY